jgi:Leucine-rich repeat (LRR) protein
MATSRETGFLKKIEECYKNQDEALFLYRWDYLPKKLPQEFGLLTHLKKLVIEDLFLNDISILADLKELKELALESDYLDDITPLSELKHLEILNISKRHVSSSLKEDFTRTKTLSKLKQLKYLVLNKNRIKDIAPLSELKELQILIMNYNLVENIAPLSELTKLWRLELNNNKIKSIAPLIGLQDLESLQLQNNRISDISSLKYLIKLKSLFLRKNLIQNIPTELIPIIENLGNWGFDIDSNPLNEEFKDKNIVQILRVLYEKSNQSFFQTKVNIPIELKNAILKYLLSFKDYVVKTKGRNIYFEIFEYEDGLEIKTRPTEETSLEEIQSYLNEYISLITQEELKIDIRSEITTQQYETIILNLKNDIAHLKNALEIANLANKYLTNSKEDIFDLFKTSLTHSKSSVIMSTKSIIKDSANSTNTNTQTQENKISQSFNFEAFEQVLPNFQGHLDFLRDELRAELAVNNSEEAKKILSEVEKLIEKSNEIEKIAEAKDEKSIKKSGFWQRLGSFAKNIYNWGKSNLSAESLKNVSKSIKEIGKIGESFGVQTGIDYENLGGE